MLTPLQTVLAVLGALGTFTTAVVAWRRAGPDRTRAWVGTAADLVAVSDGLRKGLTEQVDYLMPEVAALRAEVAEMRAHQRDRDAEMARIRARNRALEDRVALLERTMRAHGTPVPPDEST